MRAFRVSFLSYARVLFLFLAMSPLANAQLFCQGDLDLRDPKIFVHNDGRLFIGASQLSPSGEVKFIAFSSTNGVDWEKQRSDLAAFSGHWVWDFAVSDNRTFAASFSGGSPYLSQMIGNGQFKSFRADGNLEPIVVESQPNLFSSSETSVLVRADGTLLTVSRVENLNGGLSNKAYFGLSENPGAANMAWQRFSLTGVNAHGPRLIEVSLNGQKFVLLGSREFNGPYTQKSVIGQIDIGTNTISYSELLQLNANGSTYDQGYLGLYWDGSFLWASHYESTYSGNDVFYPSTVSVSKIRLTIANGHLVAEKISTANVWSGSSSGRHGAFTSITKYAGFFWLVFREGPAHESFKGSCDPGGGKIALYKSSDGIAWERAKEFSSNLKPALFMKPLLQLIL